MMGIQVITPQQIVYLEGLGVLERTLRQNGTLLVFGITSADVSEAFLVEAFAIRWLRRSKYLSAVFTSPKRIQKTSPWYV